MDEEWRPVFGYQGAYEISDRGQVRSVARSVTYHNRWGTTTARLEPARLMKLTNRQGYIEVGLSKDGLQVQKKVHRLILESFVGECPDGMETRHLNGSSTDNRRLNLAWGTPSENTFDRVDHGTHCKTSRKHCPSAHPLAKPNLEPSQARMGRRVCWACRLARDVISADAYHGQSLKEVADSYHSALLAGWRPQVLRGEDHPCAKLTADIVREARLMYGAGTQIRVLARRYGITDSAMFRVLKREAWKHVQ